MHIHTYTHIHTHTHTHIHTQAPHGHGHGLFVLATYYEGKWTTNPNPLTTCIQTQVPVNEWPDKKYNVAVCD